MPSPRTPAGEALRALLPTGADPYTTVDLACHTAFLVRDRSVLPDLVDLVRVDPELSAGLIVALAALVDVDSTPNAMLEWLGTEDGRMKEQLRMVGALAEARQEHDDAAADTLPEVTLDSMRAVAHVARLAGVMQPCGTMGGHARHRQKKDRVCYRCDRARSLYERATPEEKELLKTPLAAPGRKVSPAACGTVAGYDQHIEFGERPCTPCLSAAAAVVVTAPKQPGKNRGSCGSHVGFNKHTDKNEEPCTRCRAAQRVYDAARKRVKRAAGKPAPPVVELGEDGKPVTQVRPVCGQPRGFAAHKRRGEDPCRPCVEAQRVYEADRKRNYRDSKKVGGEVHQFPATRPQENTEQRAA